MGMAMGMEMGWNGMGWEPANACINIIEIAALFALFPWALNCC